MNWISRCSIWILKRQRNQRSNYQRLLDHGKKTREFQKIIYFCFIDYAEAFDCVNHNRPWKTLKDLGIPDHFTFLLQNVYAGQEATVRTGHGTTEWIQIGQSISRLCTVTCLFNLYAGYIWRRQWQPTPVLLPGKSHDGGAWWAAVHGVAESRMRLNDFTFIFHFHALEKEMANHSSVLAWSIPGTGEPGRLLSMGSHRVGHDWSDLAAAGYIMWNARLGEA